MTNDVNRPTRTPPVPISDLDERLESSANDLQRWHAASVLVTGGTGMLGEWIVGSLLRANDLLGLCSRVTILSRRPPSPHLVDRADVDWLIGDVRDQAYASAYDLIVHAATPATTNFGSGDAAPRSIIDTVVDGTRLVLECAARNRARLVYVSSGAVYGEQFAAVAEEAPGAPRLLEPRSAYGESKRLAELLCAVASAEGAVDAVIARLFAFIGPGLPLDSYFAAGNFLGDNLAGRPIHVAGDGRPQRSYLYCGDLPEWIWAIAARGTTGSAYNVGSEESITIRELADRVAGLGRDHPLPVEIARTSDGRPAPWYVPDTSKARLELGLEARVGVDEALQRTYGWLTRRT